MTEISTQMLSIWFMVFAAYYSLINGCGELLLAQQKDATQYAFSSNARNTGLENAGNPGANTYMIIGEITEPSLYKLQDQKYLFRLDYVLMDGVSKVSLTWKQSSWLTETSIKDYEAIDIPPQPNADSGSDFEGLGKSSHSCTYIDGDGYKHKNWFNSVGSNCKWREGTPGFDGQAAKSMALYIYNPIGCTNIAGDSQGQILLARHQDATKSLFSKNSRNTGIENEHQPEANTHMIIGKISDPTIYTLNDNKYLFHLQYVTKGDNKLYNLKWKQSSWLTANYILGFEAIDLPPNDHPGYPFLGLGKSSSSCTYLDGDAHQSHFWFNAVGTNQNCNGWGGASPGYNKEAAVYTALYMYNPTAWKAYTVQPPILEYNFDDLHESISGGDPNYDLILSGQVKIENGELVCDGSGNAISTGLIDEDTKPFNSHSFEVVVKLDDLNQQGAGVIGIDSDYYGSSGYVHYRFDSLVFNENNNDKKWISGSEYWARTEAPITNAPQEDSSVLDYVHFVVTYNDVDRYVQLYRNGAKYGYEWTPSDFLINDFRGYKIMFCQRHKDSSKDKLRGRISFGAVYDYALSSQHVFELYKNFAAPSWEDQDDRQLSGIIGGSIAAWTQFPFMVWLYGAADGVHHPYNYHSCSGSIISLSNDLNKGVILTAAHCYMNPGLAYIGCDKPKDDYGNDNPDCEIIAIEKFMQHPAYMEEWTERREQFMQDDITYNDINDIGIVYLTSAIQKQGAQVVPLATIVDIQVDGYHTSAIPPDNYLGMVLGFGLPDPDELRAAAIQFVSCVAEDFIPFKNSQVCVKSVVGLDCEGDSGGPAIHGFGDTDVSKQIGIVSFGNNFDDSGTCDTSGHSIYTFVPYYEYWIENNMNN
eukprot:856853_1